MTTHDNLTTHDKMKNQLNKLWSLGYNAGLDRITSRNKSIEVEKALSKLEALMVMVNEKKIEKILRQSVTNGIIPRPNNGYSTVARAISTHFAKEGKK
jgi:hypothetical protein